MGRAATEHELVLMAALVWLGARLTLPVPLWLGVAFVVAGLTLRQPKIALVAALLLAGSLGSRAEQNYQPLAAGEFKEIGRLVSDPRPLGLHSWRAEFRTDQGDRLLLQASGPPGWRLADAGAGDELVVSGRIKGLPNRDWYKSRHLLGAVVPSEVRIEAGPPSWQLPAEWLRNAVSSGGELLGPDRAALYTGLVIGDDRFQHRSQQETFRAVGLAHLLAVSGQNVVFLLAVASPLLSRLDRRATFVATLALLGWFAIATRLEPSVVRATLTAGIAAWSIVRGTRATGVRVLALTVALAVMLDPFLVYSVGFSLSVLASAGILIGSEVVAERLRGPAWIRLPLAITLTAQLAVAPLLVGTFGPVASVSILANVAAGWAAGLVMAWGLSGGVVAAFVPEQVGQVLQLPAGLGVWWIDFVASAAWRLPLPLLDGLGVTLALGLYSALWLVKYQPAPLRLLIVVGLTAVAVNAVPSSPTEKTVLEGGGSYWPATEQTPSVLVIDGSGDTRIVGSLVSMRISSVDYLVLVKGNRTASLVTAEVQRLVKPSVVFAPALHRVPGATRMTESAEIAVIDGFLQLEPSDDHIKVTTLPP